MYILFSWPYTFGVSTQRLLFIAYLSSFLIFRLSLIKYKSSCKNVNFFKYLIVLSTYAQFANSLNMNFVHVTNIVFSGIYISLNKLGKNFMNFTSFSPGMETLLEDGYF